MFRTRVIRAGAGLALMVALGALLVTPVSAASTSLQVEAFNFGFEGIPTKLAAGTYAVTFANDNDIYQHELLSAKLAANKENISQSEAVACVDQVLASNDFSCFADQGQFVTIANPDTVASGSVTLDKGRYIYLCGVPNRQGVPHYRLGMLRFVSGT
jgi:hypothetical protein